MALAASLFEQLAAKDTQAIPKVKPTAGFPYRATSGEACFVCDTLSGQDLGNEIAGVCPLCSVLLDFSQPQLVITHLGGHHCHDLKVDQSTSPCGLCHRPAPLCRFFLTKGKGSKGSLKINMATSTCPNLTKFSYTVAAKSSKSSPCSNVPIHCPLCSKDSPAVWRYNARLHFTREHPTAILSQYEGIWLLTNFEKREMKRVWVDRHKVPVKRTKKSKGPALVISQAHSSRVAFPIRASTTILDTPAESNVNLPLQEALEMDSDDDSQNESTDDGEINDPSSDDLDISHGMFTTDQDSEQRHDSLPSHHSESRTIESQQPETPLQLESITSQLPSSNAPAAMTMHLGIERNASEVVDGYTIVVEHPVPVETALADDSEPLRSRRKRKVRDIGGLSLCVCLCGTTISPEHIASSSGLMQCTRAGCETRWYHMACVGLEDIPRKWVCDSCDASGRERGGKQPRRH